MTYAPWLDDLRKVGLVVESSTSGPSCSTQSDSESSTSTPALNPITILSEIIIDGAMIDSPDLLAVYSASSVKKIKFTNCMLKSFTCLSAISHLVELDIEFSPNIYINLWGVGELKTLRLLKVTGGGFMKQCAEDIAAAKPKQTILHFLPSLEHKGALTAQQIKIAARKFPGCKGLNIQVL
jgi:hypothetical protein